MKSVPLLDEQQYVDRLLCLTRPFEKSVLAFYDHRIGGVCCNPRLMVVPLDDHLVHRGDGLFEALKYVDGKLYGYSEHLERMRRSAESIFLTPPCSWSALRDLGKQVALAGGERNGILRIFLGRGPGGFRARAKDSPEASLYIVASQFTPYTEKWYTQGLRGMRTSYPAKEGYLASMKTTSYLLNVLMMHEAEEQGKDIPICFTEDGLLTESAVASIALVNECGELVAPVWPNALPGTTVSKAMALLEGVIPCTKRPLREEDIFAAREVLLFGTSPDCASVVEYEGRPIGDGRPGPVAALARQRIQEDIALTGESIPFI